MLNPENSGIDKGKILLWLSSAAGLIMLLAISSSFGMGVSPDSTVYLNAADNLLAGKGLTVSLQESAPLTHYPPLYPLLLSALSVFGLSPLAAARILHSLVFGLNILCCGIIGYHANDQAFRPTFILIGLIIFSEIMLCIHTMVWTDALFICLTLGTFILLARFIEKQQMLFLVLSALLAAGAFLTRYPGITVIATAILVLLSLDKTSLKKKIINCLILGLISGLPVGIWLLRNLFLAGSTTNRKIAFHLIYLAHLNQLIRSVLFVLLPNHLVEYFKQFRFEGNKIVLCSCLLGMLIIITLTALILFRQRDKIFPRLKQHWINDFPGILKICLFFIVIYGGFLMVSISLFDYITPLDIRILSPIYVCTVILLVNLGSTICKNNQNGILRSIIILTGMILMLSYLARTAIFCRNFHQEGQGYTGKIWQQSAIINRIQNLPPETPVYSNAMGAIFFLTERRTKAIPKIYIQGKASPKYESSLNSMANDLTQRQGLLIYFNGIPNCHIPAARQLIEKYPLEKLQEGPSGTVYVIKY